MPGDLEDPRFHRLSRLFEGLISDVCGLFGMPNYIWSSVNLHFMISYSLYSWSLFGRCVMRL